MSTFLTKSDFKRHLPTEHLDRILNFDDTVLDEAELDAIADITDYLFQRYDTDSIFSKTGNNRDRNVVRMCTRVTVFYIYDRVADINIPDRVKYNYEETIAKLEKISEGKITADLPRKKTTDASGASVGKTQFRYGGENKRNNSL